MRIVNTFYLLDAASFLRSISSHTYRAVYSYPINNAWVGQLFPLRDDVLNKANAAIGMFQYSMENTMLCFGPLRLSGSLIE